jgi:hypothetical protein
VKIQKTSSGKRFEGPLESRIDLAGTRPLVSGAYRDVYQHPLDERLLVKVVRPNVVRQYAERTPWYNAWRRKGHYRGLFREVEEYLALRRRGQHVLPFIQHFVGITDTDLGFGMVVRKVRGRDGKLAPTVTALVERNGLTRQMRASIAQLLADVTQHHVVFGDISGNNIVHADDEAHGERLVIIDGLSDRLWLPVNSWSSAVNRVYCERRFARAVRELEEIDRARVDGLQPEPVHKG